MAAIKKEHIKDQMVKTAARLWDVPDNEIETSFDPLVLLMIEACAAELEKIGYSISTTHTRLLNRLADLLIPESILGPTPGSCIVSSTPVEPTTSINEQHHFYITQQIENIAKGSRYKSDFYFTPIGTFPLHKAALAYFYTGNKLFGIGKTNNKDLLYTNDAIRAQAFAEFWLAITPDKELKSLKGLSFYFDLKGHSEAENFYNSLPSAQFWINGGETKLEKGYVDKNQFEMTPEQMLNAGHGYNSKLNRQVAAIYENRFLHIAEPLTVSTSTMPDDWQLPAPIAGQLKSKELIYIKVVLSRPFPHELVDRLTCSINAFPVINRKQNTANYRTEDWVNILPLPLSGIYLDLDSVVSSNGQPYKMRTASGTHQMAEGEAVVRSSGAGKTSSQDVKEMTAMLTESIRDQSAYFSEINNEFILTRLSEISKILARLEDNMASAENNIENNHYIMLRPKSSGDVVTIKYWSCNGEDANYIKAGGALNPHNHSLMGSKDTVLLTNVHGGRDGVSETEKKSLLKQQLVSRGKIVSAEDVKLFCAQLFGDKLKKVDVQKGVSSSADKNAGFMRTIDVTLWLDKQMLENRQGEVEYLRKELEHGLANNASVTYPFRILLA